MATHGRYAILKKIADGGMAEIFLATQSGAEGFKRTVILKRILPSLSADPHFHDMLVDEAHIAMTLNHSNIVPVLDLGSADGRYFLVMELVDGWDLASILNRTWRAENTMPIGLALYIMAEVCRGLNYSHNRRDPSGKTRGIVHRDVSPQNVLVSEQGEVKVTDFGIAKALGRRERTQDGVIKGKIEFMSPEQACGAELGIGSDIFSAGALLYLLVTSQSPFDADSDLAVLLKVQKAEFAPPEEANPELSPQVARIIKTAMHLQPSRRYQSAEEMMLDLEEVLRSEFRSVGQSELKRWLAELRASDQAPTTAQLPGLPTADLMLERLPGQTLALEDTFALVALGEPFPRAQSMAAGAISPDGLAAMGTGASPVHVPTLPMTLPLPPSTFEPVPRRRGGLARTLSLLVLLGAAAAAGTYAFFPRTWDSLAQRVKRLRRELDPVVAGARTAPQGKRTVRPDPPRPVAEPQPTPPPRPLERKPPAPEDEAKRRVLAEAAPPPPDEGLTDEPSTRARRGDPRPEAEPARDSSAEPRGRERDRTTVNLVSRPAGASVSGQHGALGKTPFPLGARLGSTQVLTFSKPGFASKTKRIKVSRKTKTVVVKLTREKRAGAKR